MIPFNLYRLRFLTVAFLFCFIVMNTFNTANAQDDVPVYQDQIFVPNIKTVQFYVDPIILSDPVIPLNGASQLHLEFDDLNGDKRNYYYTVIHCNFDWTPSELSEFDYLTGFREQDIITFEFSFTTRQTYTHYEVLFPNENMRVTKSGNYILKVYADNDPDQPIITRRFVVFSSKAEVITNVHPPFDAKFTNTWQEVDFTVRYNGLSIANPITDVKVLLMQNFRWDNAIAYLQPLFMKPYQLEYSYDMENAFPGGKEFRYFDTRSIRYRTDRVRELNFDKPQTEVILFPDEPRIDEPYIFHTDINGRYVPGIVEGFNQKAEPDYTWVSFFLPFNYPLQNISVFALGKFSDWKLSDEFMMHYNPSRHGFEGRAYLKQGYYEYEYVTAEKGTGNITPDILEGDSYETENTYQVFVYFRAFGSRYDEVIAYKVTDSFNRVR
ncbi:MAG TPA: DUF5103 domain-containing protein [Chitinophagales bacterium]|nr:DUF5103 domain-containing protein [Chitinophagales bacterium]